MSSRRFLALVLLVFGLVAISTSAFAQSRARAQVVEVIDDEGSGEAIQQRAHDPRGNEARQSDHVREVNEGNEDDQGGEESQGGGN
jgi:hypothetical protein